MIIAFAGKKQSGKTTSAEFIKNIFTNQTSKVYNFADPLKQNICIDILGLTYNQCYGSDISKNELVDCYWNNKQLSAREVMQIIGTDIFRKMQNNVWANATIKKIKQENKEISIIADCRFPNEVDAIKIAGGIVIKLTRNPHNSMHESEIALDEQYYDQSNFDTIINNQLMNIKEQNNAIYEFLLSRSISPL